MKYGLILEPIQPEDYIFGDRKLGDSPINPSAQWDGWLPDIEIQNLNGIEPFACASFGTLNCVEILSRFEYGATTNYSDRFLATVSGTAEQHGNSPHRVAETLRINGCVDEKELPFDSTINTFEKFYAPIAKKLYTLALGTFAEWEFGHSFVPADATAVKNALRYSPLGFSVYAWMIDENGLYYRPQGEVDGHWVCCYGYEDGKYWKVLDTYTDGTGQALKKVRWDALPQQCKRYTLHRQVVSQSAFTKFIYWLRLALGI